MVNQFSSRELKNLWLFYFLSDVLAITASYYTILGVRFYSTWGQNLFGTINKFLGIDQPGDLGDSLTAFYIKSAPRLIVLLSLSICLIYSLMDLYPGRRFIRKRPVAWYIILSNIIALGIFYTYFYLSRNTFHPRSVFATLLAVNAVYCILIRRYTDNILRFLRARFKFDQVQALLVGNNRESAFIDYLIEEIHPHGINIVKRIDKDPGLPFEKNLDAIRNAAGEERIDMIICTEKDLSIVDIMKLMSLADEIDASVKMLSDKLNVLKTRAKMEIDVIHGTPLVHFNAPSTTATATGLKRITSFAFALTVLLLLFPLLLFIAILIRLTSHGPVLFVQERIGVNRKPFKMFKFRTMYNQADEAQAQLEEFNESEDVLFKVKKDPRVTPVGRFLRRFSIDELPQIINVLRSEMTIVGPRPLPRRDYENYYEEWHYSRHSGRPGLTCLWQVSGRSEIDFHNMCILDIFYLRNHNWILDLKIVMRTFAAILFGRGAY